MLKIYDYIDEILATQSIQEATRHVRLRYYARDLVQRLDTAPDDKILSEAIHRTIQLCVAAGIPVAHHFKKIQVFDGQNLHPDWMLSALASYLLLMNGAADDPHTAKAQVMLLLHQKVI
jgi:hypothetical protein